MTYFLTFKPDDLQCIQLNFIQFQSLKIVKLNEPQNPGYFRDSS